MKPPAQGPVGRGLGSLSRKEELGAFSPFYFFFFISQLLCNKPELLSLGRFHYVFFNTRKYRKTSNSCKNRDAVSGETQAWV